MMTPDEFRRAGHEAVEWIARYLESSGEYPVAPTTKPGELVDLLPREAPEKGEPAEALLRDFRELIVQRHTHWNHPRFLAYFSTSASAPGILGEMIAAALNPNHMLWKTSPAATELEQVTLGWLRQWMGLPQEFFGMILDTASTSTLHALAAARALADPHSRRSGNSGGLTLYCSDQAHTSVDKAAITIGVGLDNVRRVPSDEAFRMRVDALESMIREDRAAGRRPFCIVPTVGTTSTTSIDPVPAIAAIARREGAWLHIDTAYAGPAAMLPELRYILDGADEADSLVVNPHKWMFTPMDLSVLYTRRPETLRNAFTLTPEILRTAPDPRALNLMDYGVPLGRRFRSLKLWFVMRSFGREGLTALLRSHIALAREFAGWVERDPLWEIVAPSPLSVVCFRRKSNDEENQRLLEAVNASGVALLSGTVLKGRYALRVAVGNQATTREDLALVWAKLREL
ncbi:MAG: pyridoxal phosphate-dependent decarboxylase family protein [Bryobacteraceae bacterium]